MDESVNMLIGPRTLEEVHLDEHFSSDLQARWYKTEPGLYRRALHKVCVALPLGFEHYTDLTSSLKKEVLRDLYEYALKLQYLSLGPHMLKLFLCDKLLFLKIEVDDKWDESDLEEITCLVENKVKGTLMDLMISRKDYTGIFFNNDQIRRILKSQPQLDSLQTNEYDVLKWLPSCVPLLKTIDYRGYVQATRIIVSILSRLKNLKNVHLEYPEADFLIVHHHVLRLYKDLDHLEYLSNKDFKNQALLNYSKDPDNSNRSLKLQFLTLDTDENTADEINQMIQILPDLEKIKLSCGSKKSIRPDVLLMLDIGPSVKIEATVTVDGHCIFKIKDFFDSIEKNVESLELLYMSQPIFKWREDLTVIGKHFTNIETLILEDIYFTSHNIYEIDTDLFPNLEYFSFKSAETAYLPEELLIHILTRKKLKTFIFEIGCPIPDNVYREVFDCARNNQDVFSSLKIVSLKNKMNFEENFPDNFEVAIEFICLAPKLVTLNYWMPPNSDGDIIVQRFIDRNLIKLAVF